MNCFVLVSLWTSFSVVRSSWVFRKAVVAVRRRFVFDQDVVARWSLELVEKVAAVRSSVCRQAVIRRFAFDQDEVARLS